MRTLHAVCVLVVCILAYRTLRLSSHENIAIFRSAIGWGLFNQIYCITGKWSPERKMLVLEQFRRVGLESRVTFFYGRLDSNGHRGAWAAHKAVAKKAQKLQYRQVLVFEDDIRFTEDFVSEYSRYLREYAEFLDATPSWDYFLFGHNPFATQVTSHSGISRTHSWGMFAYAMSPAGMYKLASSVYPKAHGNTVDGILYSSLNTYAFYPMVVHHSSSFSQTIKHNRPEDLNDQWGRREKKLYNAARKLALCYPFVAKFYMEGLVGHIECLRTGFRLN